jgi:O-acetyl-ADP-ribose deacetylase
MPPSHGVLNLSDIPPLSVSYSPSTKDSSTIPYKLLPSLEPNLPTPNQDHNNIISVIQGDITRLALDAVVNAANKNLAGGGGVDGSIHRAGGTAIMADTDKRYPQGCPTGSAVISTGGRLPAKHVIHAVGPNVRRGEDKALLKGCYSKALEICKEEGLRSVGFCCISSDIYGYPNDEAAYQALKATKKFLLENPKSLDRVVFAVFMSEKNMEAYKNWAP